MQSDTQLNTQLILDKLNKIELELEKTNAKLDKIEQDIQELKTGTNKMNNHINFVESIYTIVRSPISDLLSYYYGEPDNLRAIEDTKS